ncbi:MAG: ribbon-helix-helix protein, CopG family [Actinobacteria bacterium]|nr:ribbon-helix-helix protein, CopG family [Actinomycetota bacterium]
MKTTLQLPDDLYRDVKATAARSGRSVTSIVEESLRRFLAEAAPMEALRPLPVSHNRSGFTDEFLASGINFDNTSDVLAWLDGLEGRLP